MTWKRPAARHGRLLADLPIGPLTEERFEELIRHPGVRFERIVSTGHASTEGFWYDQPWGELVVVVEGRAEVEVDGQGTVALGCGDWLDLPPRCRHRVVATSAEGPTVWLAVHYGEPDRSGSSAPR